MANNKFKPKVPDSVLEGDVVSMVDTVETTPLNITEEEVDAGENPETAPPIVMIEEETIKEIPEKEKKVRICMRVNHSCSIGGTTYHFEKGKQYNVLEAVKQILLKSDLLTPL